MDCQNFLCVANDKQGYCEYVAEIVNACTERRDFGRIKRWVDSGCDGKPPLKERWDNGRSKRE